MEGQWVGVGRMIYQIVHDTGNSFIGLDGSLSQVGLLNPHLHYYFCAMSQVLVYELRVFVFVCVSEKLNHQVKDLLLLFGKHRLYLGLNLLFYLRALFL